MKIIGSEEDDRQYIQQLLDMLPTADLKGLVKIVLLDSDSSQPFVGSEYLLSRGRLYRGDQEVAGTYTHSGFHQNSIHLTQAGLDRFTLYHEVGHHKLDGRHLLQVRVHVLITAWLAKGEDDADLEIAWSAGLRKYSFTDVGEFLADVYAILRIGIPYQLRALETFWSRVAPGEPSLAELLEDKSVHNPV